MTNRLITWGAMGGALAALTLSLAVLCAAGYPQHRAGRIAHAAPLALADIALPLPPVVVPASDDEVKAGTLVPSTRSALFQVSLH